MNKVELHLSDAQIKKALKGITFQASSETLRHENPNAIIGLKNKTDLNRLIKNVRDKKGFRFQANSFELLSDVEGDGFFKSIKQDAKKHQVVKKVGKYVAKKLTDEFDGDGIFKKAKKSVTKFAKKNHVGEKLKDFAIDRFEGTTGLDADEVVKFARSVKNGDVVAVKNQLGEIKKTVGQKYFDDNMKGATPVGAGLFKDAKKFARHQGQVAKKQVKKSAKQILNEAVNVGVAGTAGAVATAASENPFLGILAAKYAADNIAIPLNRRINKKIDGMGVVKKFVKGSQEAKDFMASLRAKRGNKKGVTGGAVEMPRSVSAPTEKKTRYENVIDAGVYTKVSQDNMRHKGITKGGSFRVAGGSFRVAGEGIVGGSFMPS